MTPAVAQAVLAARAALPTKLTGPSSTAVLEAWLRALGLRPDAHGRYATPKGARYEFGAQVVRYQEKREGRWSNTWSRSLIDAALTVLADAAKATGETAAIARAADAKLDRRDAKSRARAKVATRAAREAAQVVAWKEIAALEPGLVERYLRGERLPDAQLAALKERMEATATMLQVVSPDGGGLPDDGAFASAARPPVLPVYQAGFEYVWTETEGGVAYSVGVRGTKGEGAEVIIGKPRLAMLGLASFGASRLLRPFDKLERAKAGDATLVGTVRYIPEQKRYGAALIELYADAPRGGAGGRLLRIWCRMMAGYAIPAWVAVAVGPEGEAFLRARAARGAIELARHPSMASGFVVGCR